MFLDVPSISSYKDTGERFGLRSNVLDGSTETKELIPFFNSDAREGRSASFINYADLLEKEPATPVRTEDEKSKFASTWMNYKGKGERIDFASMALDWNVEFHLMKSNEAKSAQIYPKSARDLQRHYKATIENENAYQTMAQHRDETNHLTAAHRKTKEFSPGFNKTASIPIAAIPSSSSHQNATAPVIEAIPIVKGKRKCTNCGHDWTSATFKAHHTIRNKTKDCTVDIASRRKSEGRIEGRCEFMTGKDPKRCTKTNLHWHTQCFEACCGI